MTTARAVGAVSREAMEWYAIDWPAIHRNVRRLQVRIVQATKERRWGRVRALQRLLTHSYSGKVLAVRRVTENNGKATPGVDQEIWDTPEKKTQAVHALQSRGYRSQPLRRVYIPKSDGKTMRPLGIPTMIDRGQQALHLLALDPVVETTANRNSYGFRQRRSCADAIGQCFLALKSANAQWILEGDIKSCFDKISHNWLLAHVPMDRLHCRKSSAEKRLVAGRANLGAAVELKESCERTKISDLVGDWAWFIWISTYGLVQSGDCVAWMPVIECSAKGRPANAPRRHS